MHKLKHICSETASMPSHGYCMVNEDFTLVLANVQCIVILLFHSLLSLVFISNAELFKRKFISLRNRTTANYMLCFLTFRIRRNFLSPILLSIIIFLSSHFFRLFFRWSYNGNVRGKVLHRTVAWNQRTLFICVRWIYLICNLVASLSRLTFHATKRDFRLSIFRCTE